VFSREKKGMRGLASHRLRIAVFITSFFGSSPNSTLSISLVVFSFLPKRLAIFVPLDRTLGWEVFASVG